MIQGLKKHQRFSHCVIGSVSVAGIPCLIIDPVAIYPGIPDKGDIQEILENMDIEEFIQRLEAEIHAAATEEINNNSLTPPPRTREDVVRLSETSSTNDYIPDTAPIALQNFVQKAEDALFGDGLWVSIGSQLYHSVGSHYELQPERYSCATPITLKAVLRTVRPLLFVQNFSVQSALCLDVVIDTTRLRQTYYIFSRAGARG